MNSNRLDCIARTRSDSSTGVRSLQSLRQALTSVRSLLAKSAFILVLALPVTPSAAQAGDPRQPPDNPEPHSSSSLPYQPYQDRMPHAVDRDATRHEKAAPKLHQIRAAARRGDAHAQSVLGSILAREHHDAEAVSWLRKAAEHGDADAQSNLAYMYEKGRGVAVDKAQTIAWYKEAAAQGHAQAQANLGTIYANNRDVKQDAEALLLFRKSADQGNAAGQTGVGKMYDEGRAGLEQNDVTAMMWYLKAAEQGFAPAQYNIGLRYLFGCTSARKALESCVLTLDPPVFTQDDCHFAIDQAQAIAWFKRAADQGLPQARTMLESMTRK